MTEPTPDEPSEQKPAIRASDADRERVAAVVRAAVGDGRLTLVEGDERLAGVYASVHRDELAAYTRDLGVDGVPAEGAAPPAGRLHRPGRRPADDDLVDRGDERGRAPRERGPRASRTPRSR